jgi:MFS family permease
MSVFGGAFICQSWAYPSEIIPASKALVPNIVNWIALSISTLVPPIIAGIMPDNNPYPVFIFFGMYGFFGLIHVWRVLRESDGHTYLEIIRSFK